MTTFNNLVAKSEIVKVTEPVKFLLALGIGIAMGVAALPNFTIAIIYAVLSIFPIFYAFQNNIKKVFETLPYFVYAEIYFRASGSVLPYLFCPYVLMGIFTLLIFKRGATFRIYSNSFVFLFLFTLLEIFDSYRAENTNVARSLIIHTSLIFVVSLWACSTILSPALINIFIRGMKKGGLWLCGYILAAHITGHIKYAVASSFESTNGLAPVQISAYLGLLSFLFFLTVVNNSDQKNIVLNICLMVLSSTLMVLSLSRGGLYFFGILATLYFVFNAKKMSNYFMLLLLLPIALLVYSFVSETTNGVVEQRFAQEGSSGRDQLVKIGLQLFFNNPVTGIGTGNFNSEIIKEHLYGEESGAHNEFVRVIAEHGFLGIVTYWAFFVVLFFDIVRAKNISREYAFYFFVLFCLILVHNGLKIGLQSMILLLAISIMQSSGSKVISK